MSETYHWFRELPWWQALLLSIVLWDAAEAMLHPIFTRFEKLAEKDKAGELSDFACALAVPGVLLKLPFVAVYALAPLVVSFLVGCNIAEQVFGLKVWLV